MLTLFVAVVGYAVLVTVWNLVLMGLLDIAKRDVRRLSIKLHPSSQPPTLSILRPRGQAVAEQRRPGGAS